MGMLLVRCQELILLDNNSLPSAVDAAGGFFVVR